jgi:hypothetical protein
MKEREELELILNLIRKYNLPLSPILEYAIKEKMEEYPETSTADDEEVSFTENISIEAGIESPQQSYHDEQKSTIEGYSLQNQGNHCYIINDIGEKVFSSSGRLTIIEGEFYRVSYTYSFISMNLVKKDERELYVLGKRILNAHHRSPLYTALDEHEYLNQIKSIRFDYNTEEYHVQVDGRWYGSSGYFADFNQKGTEDGSKNIAEESHTAMPANDLKIVDFGERSIAVIGDTKPHKDALRAMGGYFMIRTQWGPAWTFPNKKRERIKAYIDGDTSVVDHWEDSSQEESLKRSSPRYIIHVKYPNGSEFSSNLVWETLVDVVNYAGPERVKLLNIICMGDNLVSSRLNDNPIYRTAQKDIGRGLYVCTYSSTDTKFKQIEKINQELQLGLIVEKVYIDENGNTQVKKEDEPYTWEELKSGSRDRTKYSFEGGQLFSKRRFVLEVVKYYVRCHPQISYESLIRVFPATLHSNKSNGVIKRYNDVAKQIALNPDVRNRFFMKDDEVITLSNGMKVVVHNQWGDDFDKFLKVAESLYSVKSSDVSYAQSVFPASGINKSKPLANSVESKEDKRIGYTVRLFPSQLKGVIVRVRKDSKGMKKLVVKTTSGDTVEVDDLPYLYEVLKRN